MSATGSAGVLTFESPWVVNQAARASRIRSCSALSVFPTIRRTSQRLHHKGIREGADAGIPSGAHGETVALPGVNFCHLENQPVALGDLSPDHCVWPQAQPFRCLAGALKVREKVWHVSSRSSRR